MKIIFSKKERTLPKNRIDNLYKYGHRVYSNSLILIWNYVENDSETLIKLVISVPKKKIKKAVNRNYIKRIIRETYRLNKSILYGLISQPVEIIIKYNKSTLPEFNELKAELLNLLNHDSFKKNETNT
tara:strand:- start:2186 stop:2569 length:384 start_codon:yes stop_codon:yes gene_type:complete